MFAIKKKSLGDPVLHEDFLNEAEKHAPPSVDGDEQVELGL